MAVGTSQYKGMAVPLRGESELLQITAATDFVTLTGAASISGDFIVCRDSTGATEYFYVKSDGDVVGASDATFTSTVTAGTISAGALSGALVFGSQPTIQTFRFSAPVTTALATTGLSQGAIYLVMKSSTPQLCVNISSAADSLKYFTSNTATFGRASTT